MTAALRPHRASTPLWWGLESVPADHGPSVLAIGVFDGLHRGHRRLVEHARSTADRNGLPLVLVTFDPHPAHVLGLSKDTAALSSVETRAALAGAAGADAVCVLRFTRDLAALSPQDFAEQVLAGALQARAVVVGANFTFGARAEGDVAALHALGDQLGFVTRPVPLLTTVDVPCSSSHVRRCIRDGNVDGAARVLGRPHSINGMRSGTLISVAPGTAIPAYGRYRVAIDERVGVVEVLDKVTVRVVAGGVGDGPVTVEFLQRDGAER